MGVENLRIVFDGGAARGTSGRSDRLDLAESGLSLRNLIDKIEAGERGVITTMGNGGVGEDDDCLGKCY